MGGIPKDLRPIARRLRREGWTVEPVKGHIKWRDADGNLMVTSSSTPNDQRAITNARRDVRRAAAERGIELT
jgi:hypothetical protein